MLLDQLHIEALVFASEGGIALDDLVHVLSMQQQTTVKEDEVLKILNDIRFKYESEMQIFSLHVFKQHYQFLTKSAFHPILQQLEAYKEHRKLSQSAIETLSIIAYRQPVTKLEVEEIRGVNCDYSIHKLLEKNLIQIQGKSQSIGKPLLYGTSQLFMNYFGLNSLADLPQLKDIQSNENTIGDITE